MNAEQARQSAANSQQKVRNNVFESIEAMAKYGYYLSIATTYYPELIEELNQLGYTTKENSWGSLEISWKPKN
jgi:hypothetical protein